ncbi:hypothetical protein NE237_014117 [Protea cynaroides]|uniref:ABC transmembrane type-1 domain-containing protein n=1 Tax=Protea cynaroides TaxID=273540 RepID=A0A9Q0JYK3_9MAGN|nr:hypothetical protein NE237_014117 [Protea cynaroides]
MEIYYNKEEDSSSITFATLTTFGDRLHYLMIELHSLWLTLPQVGAAFALLFSFMGISVVISVVAAFLRIIALSVFTVFGAKRNNRFQFNGMKNCDSRLKAINEMLNYMRVIKFQTWEQHFNKRIQAFRKQSTGGRPSSCTPSKSVFSDVNSFHCHCNGREVRSKQLVGSYKVMQTLNI